MGGSQQEQDGGAGESEVMAAFQRLGWGPMANARHDRGSDLFALARDERGVELGLIVGLQVKTGPSYFKKPVRTPNDHPPGWWFYDPDGSHIEAWATHGVPHLIVLHDLTTRTSYWAHVTTDAIVRTGKGAKVLVPAANTVDEEHLEALLAVAATLRSGVVWEGSAWTGAGSVPPRDRLRHALVVPRIIAPHPNAGLGATLTPEQAVAMLVNARADDLAQFAETHAEVPSLTEAAASPEWGWRFVGALAQRVTTGEIEGLLRVVNDAPDPSARAASAVTAASGLLENARADEAVTLLEAALARGDACTVDHAWLTVQHARACVEIGRIEQARADALAVQAIRSRAPEDVTASAMAGAAIALLFNTSGWGPKDTPAPGDEGTDEAAGSRPAQTRSRGVGTPVSIGEPDAFTDQSIGGVIAGADTVATWWRTQTASWGLNALANRAFNAWAQDATVTTGGPDVVSEQLGAAALTASLLGDRGGWCHQASLLGRDALMRLDRHADPETARSGLSTLRLAGDEAALKLAIGHLAADGPAAAVTLAAAEVRLNMSTRTTAPADLALLQHGGDLLDEETAQQTVSWLFATLQDPTSFVDRTRPLYALEFRLIETIVSVAAHPGAQLAVLEHLLTMPAQTDPMLALSWARVLRALPQEAWTAETARRAAQAAEAHHAALRMALLRVAARHDQAASALLRSEARSGSLDALSAIGDVRDLSSEDVRSQIDALADQVEGQVQDAKAGSFGIGGRDVGSDLAVLNAWHPDAAKWTPLFDLLADDAVAIDHKRGSLETLASLAEQLPSDIQTRLTPIATAIAERSPSGHTSLFDDGRDLVGEGANLGVALGTVSADWIAGMLLGLLSGGAHHRYWAALIVRRLKRPQDTGILVALAQDPDPDVRAAAAAGLASLVTTEQSNTLAVSALKQCLRDPGRKVPATIAVVLAESNGDDAVAQEALNQLRTHSSAYVRATATRALQNSA
jgi:hypothetical protein